MRGFRFDGVIPASKSIFNRALICASYGSSVTLKGHSSCEDVTKMRAALLSLGSAAEYDCGSAGTVLRFLALRLSRIPGRHRLKGTQRLFSRPQAELKDILSQLGVSLHLFSDHLVIEGQGWRVGKAPIKVSRKNSSQFASALLLNSWGLDSPLEIVWDNCGVSDGYWQMTVHLVRDFGMDFAVGERRVSISPMANPKVTAYEVESDLSSAFAIAAYAALNGEAIFRHFPFASLQPDGVFVSILEDMGAGVEVGPDHLRVFRRHPHSHPLVGIRHNLSNCPDLFPVLATLCAFARGPSLLDGAPQLVQKESNRINKTNELIRHMGVQTKVLTDGIEIYPPERLSIGQSPFTFDTDHDHRLAFAAALLSSQKFPIKILHPEVVNKSFPEFWDIIINSSPPS